MKLPKHKDITYVYICIYLHICICILWVEIVDTLLSPVKIPVSRNLGFNNVFQLSDLLSHAAWKYEWSQLQKGIISFAIH